MERLMIHAAAEATGWSPRMLRYLERLGLIEAPRTASGYRVYGPGELRRLRGLRELLRRFGCSLSEVAFAKRLRTEPELRAALERWFEEAPRWRQPAPSAEWLRFDQEKQQRLLAA
jgi:MerR family copper efflux transcriptional regulator